MHSCRQNYLQDGCVIEQVVCEFFESLFICQQNLEQRKQSVHGINSFFKCNIFPKTFIKREPLADHIRKVYRAPNIVCLECGKIKISKQHHKEHMEMHKECAARHKAHITELSINQQYKRTQRLFRAVRHLESYAICIENELILKKTFPF